VSLYQDILVVVTEASAVRPAFDRAMALARAGAAITVLDVAEPASQDARTWVPAATLAAVEAKADEQRRAALAAIAGEAARAGAAIRTETARGSAFRLAIQAVLRERHDLVLKTVDARGPRARSPLGSVDRHLLRKCPCPVWLVSPDGEPPGAVLAAVNPDPADPEENALSAVILRSAAAVAALDGRELHVLHAWKVLGEVLAGGPQPVVSDPEVDFIVGRALTRHAGFMDDLLMRTPLPVRAQPHVVHARAADAIIDFVGEYTPSLLVMGTVGRTGLPGLLIGNTAERVLNEVTCSVLALKPKGFVSPVTLEP
jgi:nucleotide-binding universal stress UspA family protein